MINYQANIDQIEKTLKKRGGVLFLDLARGKRKSAATYSIAFFDTVILTIQVAQQAIFWQLTYLILSLKIKNPSKRRGVSFLTLKTNKKEPYQVEVIEC